MRIVLAAASLLIATLTACGGGSGGLSVAGSEGKASSSVSSGGAVNTSSQSYRMGLATGTKGDAEMRAYGSVGLGGKVPPVSYQQACQTEWDLDNGSAPDLNLVKKDYMAGCLYGLNHNDSQWTQGRQANGGN